MKRITVSKRARTSLRAQLIVSLVFFGPRIYLLGPGPQTSGTIRDLRVHESPRFIPRDVPTTLWIQKCFWRYPSVFPPLRPAEKNIKHPRPAVVNDVVTPEGTRYSKLFFDAASKGVVINVPYEYSFTTEGVQQAQINLPRGKSTGRLAILVVKHKET